MPLLSFLTCSQVLNYTSVRLETQLCYSHFNISTNVKQDQCTGLTASFLRLNIRSVYVIYLNQTYQCNLKRCRCLTILFQFNICIHLNNVNTRHWEKAVLKIKPYKSHIRGWPGQVSFNSNQSSCWWSTHLILFTDFSSLQWSNKYSMADWRICISFFYFITTHCYSTSCAPNCPEFMYI